MGARRLLVTAGAGVLGLGLICAVVVPGSGQAMAAQGKPAAVAGHGKAGHAKTGHAKTRSHPAAARPVPAAQGIAVTVTKTADPDPYVPGEPLTFTVSL